MPADSRHTKERILATATLLFAEHGYDGVSLRTIATEAKTHLALIHYHFGTKDDLYRAIWANRYGGPIEWRKRMFAEIDYSQPREELLQLLVDIFMRPIIDLMQGDPVSKSFMHIMGHEMGDMKETQRGVLRDYLDPTGCEVMNAFQRALPEISATDVAWGFQAMAGTATLHIVDVDRISRMSGGAAKSGDSASAYPRLRAFLVGGWLELARRCERMPSEVGKYPWRTNGEAPLVSASDRDPMAVASELPAQQLRRRSKARRPFARARKLSATR
jgi:AcrR family transcriptional regulator